MTKPLPLMLIEWVDSAQPTSNWQHLADYEPSGIVECVSVGYLVHDGDDNIALAQNLGAVNEESAQASGVIHIPACSVTGRVELKQKKRK